MKRTPLRRGKPLRAKGGDRFPKNRDNAYRDWIRGCSCCLCLWETWPTEVAHVKTRGSGGPDRGNCLPMCTKHHREQHRIGIRSFEALYNVDLGLVAAWYDAEYVRQAGATEAAP